MFGFIATLLVAEKRLPAMLSFTGSLRSPISFLRRPGSVLTGVKKSTRRLSPVVDLREDVT